MITSAFLWLLYLTLITVTAPLRIFDDVSSVAGLGGNISTAGGYLSSIDPFVPVLVFTVTVGIVLTIEFLYWSYQVIRWVYSKIPGVN